MSAAFLAFALLVAATNACSPKYLVVCPEVLQVGVEQTIAVSLFSEQTIPIKVQIEKFDGSVINGTEFVDVSKGTTEFKIRVPCVDVTEPSEGGTRYAYVRVLSRDDQNCHVNKTERRRVILSLKSTSVFVQTDKPVYRRDDEVRIRFVAVKSDLTPVEDQIEVTVDIKNPQGVVVNRFVLKSASADKPTIQKHSLSLGHDPMFGKWTISAKYGCKNSEISDFHFQVEDYVLPRFEVIITPPKIINSATDHIVVGVKSIYTYGKPVVGRLNVTLGIAERNSTLVRIFRTELFEITSNDKGTKKLTFPNDGYGVFPEGKLLYIYAEVTEKASFISQSNRDRTAVFTAVPILLDCSLSKPFYAPLLPYELIIQAKYANGESAAQKDIKIVAAHDGKELTEPSDENGMASFRLQIDTPANNIAIRASVGGQLEEEVCQLQAYQTSCKQYMVVTTRIPVPFEKGSTATFEIVKGENNANGEFDFHVAVISCGKLQKTSTEKNINGPISSFQVKIKPSYCSTICVVAYYETKCDGSSAIISDYLCTDVEEQCSNNIILEVNARDNTARPGQDVQLTITAAKDSDIALMAVDKGLYLINDETKLTKKKIFNELRRYDTSCEHKLNGVEGIFSAMGLTSLSNKVMSPVQRDSEKCPAESRRRREVLQVGECMCNQGKEIQRITVESASVNTAEKSLVDRCRLEHRKLSIGNSTLTTKCPNPSREDITRFLQCCSPEEELKELRGRSGDEQDPYSILNDESSEYFEKRTYFPHVWLYNKDFQTQGDTITTTIHVHVPDTITDWSIQGLAFSKQGFCAADPIFLRALKAEFVECHVPFSLRRQEQITIACTVYNYKETRSTSKTCLRLVDPGEDMCTTAGSGKSTDAICFFMEASSTKTVLFPVVPLKTGKLKLKVRLTTEFAGEDVETEILVEPEGVVKDYSYSAELDPQGANAINAQHLCKSFAAPKDLREGQCYRGPSYLPSNNGNDCLGELFAKHLTKQECCDNQIEKFAVSWSDGTRCELCPTQKFERQCIDGSKKQINTFYVRLPENYVAGSDTAWLSVTGNYFQGTLEAVDDVEKLLRQPGGCGEQSIARFAPNVAIVKHLNATGELYVEVRNKYTDLIQRGYAYQLKYRKQSSGAFAKYQHTPASTWLSSFVLQTFCDARHFANIDENVIQSLITFLTTRQLLSGAFKETYATSYYLIGGVKEGDASLTAYVVNGALECCQAPNHPFFTPNATAALCKAVQFLELYVQHDEVVRPYSRAIVYAALVKACKTCSLCQCRTDMLTKARLILDQVSTDREDGARYWSANGQPLPNGAADPISVETTAYALCGYVEEGHINSSGSLAKWLNSERNAAGAFKSTQDTVVALRCLAKFAGAIKLKRALTVNITTPRNKTFARVFHINDANKDLNQRVELPRNDIIRVESTGNGLGMLQVNVEYNEPTTENDECKFNFSVTPETLQNNDILLAVCAQYTGDVDTDQAMIEVELPTGYVACKNGQQHCLKELNETLGKSIRLDRIETSGRGAIFYFDQIGSAPENRTCFKFRATREYEARSLTSVSAKVYYYYRRDQSCTIFYALDDAIPDLAVLCSKPETGKEPLCVCGAGRCPKLEPIKQRLCNACLHHDYVYRVQVKKIKKENGWQKIKVNIVDILKPGRHDFKRRDDITLWMPTTCSQSLPFKIEKDYHIQGEDGVKFVLDHTSLVEKWPGDKSTCTNAREECEERCKCKNRCNRRRRNREKKCMDDCEDKYKDCKKAIKQFSKYVVKLRDEKGAECELPEEKLCQKE